MDENQTDQRQGCHLDLTGGDSGVVIVAASQRIVNELWWFAAAQRARATENLPRIPAHLRRVPGAHCPVSGCTHHHGDLDDPPQLATSP